MPTNLAEAREEFYNECGIANAHDYYGRHIVANVVRADARDAYALAYFQHPNPLVRLNGWRHLFAGRRLINAALRDAARTGTRSARKEFGGDGRFVRRVIREHLRVQWQMLVRVPARRTDTPSRQRS